MDFSQICKKIEEFDTMIPVIPFWCIWSQKSGQYDVWLNIMGSRLPEVKDRIDDILKMSEEEFVEEYDGNEIQLYYDFTTDNGFCHVCDIRKPIGYDSDW